MRSLINLFAFWLGLLVILAAAVMSSGCVAGDAAEPTGQVREVKLTDGTRCALFVGYYKGGITCDWGSGK